MTVAVHDVDAVFLQRLDVTDQRPQNTSCLHNTILMFYHIYATFITDSLTYVVHRWVERSVPFFCVCVHSEQQTEISPASKKDYSLFTTYRPRRPTSFFNRMSTGQVSKPSQLKRPINLSLVKSADRRENNSIDVWNVLRPTVTPGECDYNLRRCPAARLRQPRRISAVDDVFCRRCRPARAADVAESADASPRSPLSPQPRTASGIAVHDRNHLQLIDFALFMRPAL